MGDDFLADFEDAMTLPCGGRFVVRTPRDVLPDDVTDIETFLAIVIRKLKRQAEVNVAVNINGLDRLKGVDR